MVMNERVRQQIYYLPKETIQQIKIDYREGTGLTLWDLSRKYGITFSACFYIVRR